MIHDRCLGVKTGPGGLRRPSIWWRRWSSSAKTMATGKPTNSTRRYPIAFSVPISSGSDNTRNVSPSIANSSRTLLRQVNDRVIFCCTNVWISSTKKGWTILHFYLISFVSRSSSFSSSWFWSCLRQLRQQPALLIPPARFLVLQAPGHTTWKIYEDKIIHKRITR